MVHQAVLQSKGLSGCPPSPWAGCWGYYFHRHGSHPGSGGFLYRNWETCWCFTGGMTGWLYLGSDQAIIPDIEWMNQILLMMDIVNSGNLVEITFFQELCIQNRVKSLVLSLASKHQEHCAQDEMKQLEESWKAWAQGAQTPQPPVASYCQEHYDNRPASATNVQKKQIPLHLSILSSFVWRDSGCIILMQMWVLF